MFFAIFGVYNEKKEFLRMCINLIIFVGKSKRIYL